MAATSTSQSSSSSISSQQYASSISLTATSGSQQSAVAASVLSPTDCHESNQNHWQSTSPASSSSPPPPLPYGKSIATITPVPPVNRSSSNSTLIVRINTKYLARILENTDKITALFGVQYIGSNISSNKIDENGSNSLIIASDDERGYRSLLFQCANTTTVAASDNDIADLCTSLQVKFLIIHHIRDPCRVLFVVIQV